MEPMIPVPPAARVATRAVLTAALPMKAPKGMKPGPPEVI
jgi:hypothetical protein